MKVTLTRFIDKLGVGCDCMVGVVMVFGNQKDRTKKLITPTMIFKYSRDLDSDYKKLFKNFDKPLWSLQDFKDVESDLILEAIHEGIDIYGKSIMLNVTTANVKKFAKLQGYSKRGFISELYGSIEFPLVVKYLKMGEGSSYWDYFGIMKNKKWDELYEIAADLLQMTLAKRR